jgi:hypothetical protein
MRLEKKDVRPRLRLDKTISSNSAILGSFDFGLTLSLSLMNSLKPKGILASAFTLEKTERGKKI